MDAADSIKLTSCDQVPLYRAPIERGQRGIIWILPDLCLPGVPDHFACCVMDVPDLDAIRARGKQVVHGCWFPQKLGGRILLGELLDLY